VNNVIIGLIALTVATLICAPATFYLIKEKRAIDRKREAFISFLRYLSGKIRAGSSFADAVKSSKEIAEFNVLKFRDVFISHVISGEDDESALTEAIKSEKDPWIKEVLEVLKSNLLSEYLSDIIDVKADQISFRKQLFARVSEETFPLVTLSLISLSAYSVMFVVAGFFLKSMSGMQYPVPLFSMAISTTQIIALYTSTILAIIVALSILLSSVHDLSLKYMPKYVFMLGIIALIFTALMFIVL